MGPDDLRARCRRLGEISRGLAKELTLWEGAPYPIPFDSRLEYLEGLRSAIRGLERSRVALHWVATAPVPFPSPPTQPGESSSPEVA